MLIVLGIPSLFVWIYLNYFRWFTFYCDRILAWFWLLETTMIERIKFRLRDHSAHVHLYYTRRVFLYFWFPFLFLLMLVPIIRFFISDWFRIM